MFSCRASSARRHSQQADYMGASGMRRAGQVCPSVRTRPKHVCCRWSWPLTPLHRLGSVTTLAPVRQVQQIALQVLSVRLPGLAEHPGSRVAFEREVSRLKALDRVNVVPQFSELCTTTAFCRLSYAIKRASHVVNPHRSAGYVRRDGISLGPPPSLHHLHYRRDFTRSFVRRLLRYYAVVRFPVSVTDRCTPISFSMPSVSSASQRATEHGGTSRFPNKVLAGVRRAFDRARFICVSPLRRPRCDLRLTPTASAPRSTHALRHGAGISRHNTRAARPPVNASPTPLRMCTHDSGSP